MDNYFPLSPNRDCESVGSYSPASSSGGSSPYSPSQSQWPITNNEGWANQRAAPLPPQLGSNEHQGYYCMQQQQPSSQMFGHMAAQNLNFNYGLDFQYGQNCYSNDQHAFSNDHRGYPNDHQTYPNDQRFYSSDRRNFQNNQRVYSSDQRTYVNDQYHHATSEGQRNCGPEETQRKYPLDQSSRRDCNDQGSRRNPKLPLHPNNAHHSKDATMNHLENPVPQRPSSLKHHHQESNEDIQNRSLDVNPKRQRTVSTQERPSSSSSAESSETEKRLDVTFQEMSINCNREPKLPPQASWNSSALVIPARAARGPRNSVQMIQVFANYFPIRLPQDPPTVFVYTFEVERKYQKNRKIPVNVRRAILTQWLLQLDTKCSVREYGLFSDYSKYIYSLKELSSLEQSREIEGEELIGFPEENGSTFYVRIAYDNRRRAWDPQILADKERFYNILLCCVMHKHFTRLGKDFVSAKNISPPEGIISNYQGINASFRFLEQNQIFLNIDVNKLQAYSGREVLDALEHHLKEKVGDNAKRRIQDVTTWSNHERHVASTFLQNLEITYPLSRDGIVYRKVVRKVHPRPASKTFLENSTNNKDPISLYQYYKRTPLQYPQGPVLECDSGKIPAELCTIKPAQLCPQSENNGRKLQLSPGTRYKAIEKAQRTIAGTELLKAYTDMPAASNEAAEPAPDNPRMHTMHTRVLAPPTLAYGPRLNALEPELKKIAVIEPKDGTWDVWATNDKEKFGFHQSAQVHSWAILNLTSIDTKKLASFAGKLIEKASTKNMTFPPPSHIVCIKKELKPESDNASNVELLERELGELKTYLSQEYTLDQELAELEKTMNEMQPSIALSERKKKLAGLRSILKMQHITPWSSIILVVIPKKGSLYYNQVKQAAELKVGVLTQCIVQANLEQPSKWDKVLGNLLLEMNAKLGSVNHLVVESPKCPGSFGLLDAPVMILGADVSHPPPGSSKLWNGNDVGPPSYVGVTASLDRTGMPYMMLVEAQKREGKGAAEVIQNLEEIVKKFISHFQNRARMFPSKIVYFRDGVSDSQFHEVLDKEMLAIRRACASYGEGLKPQITFVVVQKRHRTRFFTPDTTKPGEEAEVTNPPSGTVVDEDIVSSGTTDFYLISHKGLLGTSRPTRYQVLWDDSGLSMNEIETLAYYLCFMYARCNRAVKVPAPTYYAHWAAKRAEALCQGWAHDYYSDLPELNNLLRKREELDCAKEYPMHFI